MDENTFFENLVTTILVYIQPKATAKVPCDVIHETAARIQTKHSGPYLTLAPGTSAGHREFIFSGECTGQPLPSSSRSSRGILLFPAQCATGAQRMALSAVYNHLINSCVIHDCFMGDINERCVCILEARYTQAHTHAVYLRKYFQATLY